jgi:tetrapyrrole methylase family protein/MazG family protein/ATP diphosphatase
VEGVCDKLIRRHPHVFGDRASLTAEGVTLQWSEIKAAEKAAKGAPPPASRLDGVPLALPALSRALKLQQKAARVGFDWDNASQVIAKIREETEEVAEELGKPGGDPSPALEEEIGDLLFVVANLARHARVDPEQALRAANMKFTRRFQHIERRLAEEGRTPEQASLEEMEALWGEAKQVEKKP